MLVRVHSLLGVVPLAAYLCMHAYDNWPALRGREAWVDSALHVPGRIWIALFVLLPMLAHGLLGLRRARAGRLAGKGDGGTRLQLITGLLVLAFLALHLGQVWGVSDGPHASTRAAYALFWTSLGRPVVLVAYLLGVSAACVHLGHGLPRAARTLAPALSSRTWLALRVGGGLFGVVLWLAFLQVLAHFALGQALFPT